MFYEGEQEREREAKMASITSLGAHVPAALSYLIAEGLLRPDPPKDAYHWEINSRNAANSAGFEEELLWTDHCVAWSRAGIVQRIFRFDVEAEPVKQAIFAAFPSEINADLNGQTSPKSPKSGNPQDGAPDGKAGNIAKHASVEADTSQRSDAVYTDARDGRAIVIVFTSQAQIFLLSGTNHVVHLPFEVEAMQALPHGVLIQRKVTEDRRVLSQQTPHLPTAPQNTFVFSQLSASQVSSTHNNAVEAPGAYDGLFQPLIKDLHQTSNVVTERQHSNLYCLLNPVDEIGAVVCKGATRSDNKDTTRKTRQLQGLSPNERILYVSPKPEISESEAPPSIRQPLILAVTSNTKSGQVSLWTVSYLNQQRLKDTKYRQKHGGRSGFSRRHSSHSRAVSAGAMTPINGNATSTRASLGVSQSFVQRGHNPVTNEAEHRGLYHDPFDLAFDESSGHAGASRRVSSLLARSDLAASKDRTSLDDFTLGHGKRKSRRGPSLGPTVPHLGVTASQSSRVSRPRDLTEVNPDPHLVDFHDLHMDKIKDEASEIFHSQGHNSAVPVEAHSAMRRELLFDKIGISQEPFFDTFEDNAVGSRSISRVASLRSPDDSIQSSADKPTLFLSITDPSTRRLLMLEIQILGDRSSRKRAHRLQSSRSWKSSIQVNQAISHGVLDACKVSDGKVTRLLTLNQDLSGPPTMVLQAPWSRLLKVNLPSPLHLIDRYRVDSERLLRRKHEAFRRVLSPAPGALCEVCHPEDRGIVDVLDSEGIFHRLQLQLQSSSPFVRGMISVCDAVLSVRKANQEAFLRAWWDAMIWLQSEKEEDSDLEWTAAIVVIFSVAAPFLQERRSNPVKHQRKRKSGLIRSSSGTNLDMDSWEEMLAQEHDLGSSSGWEMTTPWRWVEAAKRAANTTSSRKSKFQGYQPSSLYSMAGSASEESTDLARYTSLALDFIRSPGGQLAVGPQGYLPIAPTWDSQTRNTALPTLLVALHLFREDMKLNILAEADLRKLTPILAQLGTWLGWPSWNAQHSSFFALENSALKKWIFDESRMTGLQIPSEPFAPPSMMHFIENAYRDPNASFMSLADLSHISKEQARQPAIALAIRRKLADLTPRTMLIIDLLAPFNRNAINARIEEMTARGLSMSMLEALPEGLAVSFRTAFLFCQSRPLSSWDSRLLKWLGRDDLASLDLDDQPVAPYTSRSMGKTAGPARDYHSICESAFDAESFGPYDGSAEADRQLVTRLLFKHDQRFAEAAKLVHPLLYPVARCSPEPEWSETELLEAQQDLAKMIAMRTLSVSLGRGLIFYDARVPLQTEKFPIHGFSLSCVMKPSDTTVTAERAMFTEEKVAWAFFHAGVEAGLSIARDAKGVSTSWVLFNKARDLSNRHAGFLLALGLNGHLKSIAKWLAFKYLTPKHSMTSIGLLLGLSASYLGTKDVLITRLLSVHVTRMLPFGAAELNLSPLTQTAGMMGIGLLYCQSQHRRMSEVMLSEMENLDDESNGSAKENLRDEGYRLAAGFALGYINLGKGNDLKGLHDMHVTKRLLAIAVAPREADHMDILDRATAGATVALALIFIKTGDHALARKLDIPDTSHQFESVRPDHFLLRTVARHLILWQEIRATLTWVHQNTSSAFEQNPDLTTIRILTSEDLPFLNTVAGLCLVIGLRYAGSGSIDARNVLLHYLQSFMRICKLPTLNYDGKLARITVRNCQDLVALAASTIMAGTGDVQIFRCLRSLHGRTDHETPYGSHLATHFAIGILFLGGGTFSLGTSDIAVASLLCAFYPLFPTSVLDNKSHLQAFRHLWVLAVESRCLVVRDLESNRPISLSVAVTLKTGAELNFQTPCLLPDFESIAKIRTTDQEFWQVDLNLSGNPKHLQALKRHPNIYVRRRAAYDAHTSVFSATMQALNDSQLSTSQFGKNPLSWIFALAAFANFDRAAQEIVLPTAAADNPKAALLHKGTRGTALDDQLMLEKVYVQSDRSERLWNLRLLLTWSEILIRQGEDLRWIGREVVEGLRTSLAIRRRVAKDGGVGVGVGGS